MYRIALIILGCMVLPATLPAKDTLRVGTGQQYTRISSALQAAQAHDVILILPGNYREGQLIIDKPLTIIGKGYPVIDGNYQHEILTVIADSVHIEGLQIQNVGTSYIQDRAGLSIENCTGCSVRDNILKDTYFGIYFKHSRNSTVSFNRLHGLAQNEISSGNAIHLWYCQNILVESNQVSGHRDGIYLEFVDSSLIVSNISENNLRYGLHFMFSHQNTYQDNTFRNNGAGVAVMFSKRILMKQNRFIDNWGSSSYGLLLKEIYDGSIEDNLFKGNTIALYAEGANRLKIQGNDFRANGWALKVLGSCMDNAFEGNNFINNSFDLSTNSNRNYNRYRGNYWSEYRGYDLDRDGLGDVPFRPMNLFSYVVSQVDPAILLHRSLFVKILDLAEKVTPIFTPAGLMDEAPLMFPRQ